MEVTIAMLILAVTLTALLEAQTVSLHNATRTRGVTIASLLARSKMIDIEQHLFDEGFTMGEDTDDGDFGEEGQETFKWKYRIAELEMDLSSLSALCGGFSEDEGGSESDCEGMLSGFAGPFESLTEELGRSMRMVELTVTWPNGKGTESMEVRALVTREDFAMQPALGGDLQFPADSGDSRTLREAK
jgi:general secretion pathway protein I